MEKRTDGHSLALNQLKEISAKSNGAIVIERLWPINKHNWFQVDFSFSCEHIEKIGNDGFSLRQRETFAAMIPPNFPFKPPSISALNKRFAGYPHVQWENRLCLYQAEANEWLPSDGMFGLIDRLNLFLKQGAAGQLDPHGAPLHPPAAYRNNEVVPAIIPLADAPHVDEKPWIGFGRLRYPYDDAFCQIESWTDEIKLQDAILAPAFLLSAKMPTEYPTKLGDLLSHLEQRGIDKEEFYRSVFVSLLNNAETQPLIIIIGAPMRGISGAEHKIQHLACWKLLPDSLGLKVLRLGLNTLEESEERKELGSQALALFENWAQSEDTKIDWLPIYENRPEIVVRRDIGSYLTWYEGKSVALWGCGALGSSIAEMLARAGARSLILRDDGRVKPGILARQAYDHSDIHQLKVEALKRRLLRINPDLKIVASHNNLLDDPLDRENWTDSADIIIETTGSNAVLEKLELVRKSRDAKSSVPILSLAISHNADMGLGCLSLPLYSGGPKDVLRKTKIHCSREMSLVSFADEFWPLKSRHELFQPEPGCSEPTFIGSLADVISLSSKMMNELTKALIETHDDSAFSVLISNTAAEPHKETTRIVFHPDIISKDSSGTYEIRISTSAWREILSSEQRAKKTKPVNETGGVLFGEFNDACRVLWVTDACGPPPDSEASPTRFICGTVGVASLNAFLNTRSRGSSYCVGMWHTHPGASPLPSDIDIDGMERVVSSSGSNTNKSLLLIVGDKPQFPCVFTSVFSKGKSHDIEKSLKSVQKFPKLGELPGSSSIGLALSGGGSRAIAFHLGCLRALHYHGALGRVRVVSTISGGSVIGAMYAYSTGTFEEFEAEVIDLLHVGIQKSIARNLLFSPLIFKVLWTLLTSGIMCALFGIFSLFLKIVRFIGVKTKWIDELLPHLHPPLLRWYNRSDALKAALSNKIFGTKKLVDQRRNNLDIVINATELRTGTAFRFGSQESGSWRFGRIANQEKITVADAVAASACFPILLPAFDKVFSFLRKGKTNDQRVLLIDGGVYDNLGTTPIEPHRSAEFSTNAHKVDFLIACSAGPGMFEGRSIPYWWPSRMIQSFETAFRRGQDTSVKALFGYLRSGDLKGLIIPYLGQMDSSIPCPPPDLISRESVMTYPTDFAAMTDEDIERLSKRGEQLTRHLLSLYCQDL